MLDEELNEKLLAVTNQLLDMGKRNRLLNYKDSGLKTLKILNRNVEEVFRGIRAYRELNVLDLDPILSKYHRENEENETPIEYSEEKVFSIANKLLEKNQIFAYKKGYTLDKVLKSLQKDFRFSIIEKGINSLYITFAFIHYKEEDVEYVAPLLLIPIEMSNETGKFIVKQYEDEVMLNPTLRYYFSTTYHFELPQFSEEALPTYLNKVMAILPEGFSLESGCAFGVYSFYKMNMYNDLISNKDKVIKNKNIRALLGEKQTDDELKESNIYPVVNCDSSQLEAIESAAMGKSFCLQGPPGSGKSQTITNMISSLLGNGKKILFVSEKIAALNVVYENLRRAKLSDFAIELHSNKGNKKEFIDNLYNTATLPKYEMDFKTRAISSRYQELRGNLTSYEEEIHAKIPGLDMTLLDLYSLYESIPLDVMDFKLPIELINLFDIELIKTPFLEYERCSKIVGYDYRKSSLNGITYGSKDYLLLELNDDLDLLVKHIKRMLALKEALKDINSLCFNSLEEGYSIILLLNKLSSLKSFYPCYLNTKGRDKLSDCIERYVPLRKSIDMSLFDIYQRTILNENIDALITKLNENSKGIFKNKEYKDTLKIVLGYRKGAVKNDEIISELTRLSQIKKNLLLIGSLETILKSYLGNISNVDFQAINQDLKTLNGLKDYNLSILEYNKILTIDSSLYSTNSFKNEIKALTNISKMANTATFYVTKVDINDAFKKINGMSEERSHIYTYAEMIDAVNQIKKLNALDYLNTYLDKERDLKDLYLEYKKLFYKQKIDSIVEASSILKSFRSLNEEEVITEFRDLDQKLLNINRDFIIAKTSQRRPDKDVLIEGSEFKILDHEHSKLRRQLPIRSLLSQTFELALEIKPVFLMSPLSVSTYLASELDMFDCVIFDEASQIFACDALGSIYRAKQCIVIGDTKQMPPTAFFQATTTDESMDVEYDLDSILDKASETFETRSLKWHYRSRSEELITFSNQSFYNNNLITIPQSKEHEEGFGVDFYFVSDGLYDAQTRTNQIEAERVCDMVFKHLKTSKKSLGVVAFSNVQADLISSLIEKRLKKNPEDEKYFNQNIDEPFFVKNLESVQGDERDRIIFSICYGYNKEGKFYQRFGPLNNSGGERRLNVAITRAKYNVSVVSSIKYTDIKTTTEAKGVLLLRDYLEFAENVIVDKKYESTDDGILSAVTYFVESLGYEVYPNYGASAFKIDLAVKKDGKFILAIMVDKNNSYTNNVTDKYRLEQMLLERLGWRYFRLFTTSWVKSTTDEQERLSRALMGEDEEKLVEARDISYLKVDKSLQSLDVLFDDYVSLNVFRAKDHLASKGLDYVVREMIELEAPIHEDFLCKKMAMIMDKTKVTPQLKEEIMECVPRDIINNNGFLYKERFDKLGYRINSNRNPEWVHLLEYIDGIEKIVSKHNGISTEGCYRTFAELLGSDKLTQTIRKNLDEALSTLLTDGTLYLENNSIYLN